MDSKINFTSEEISRLGEIAKKADNQIPENFFQSFDRENPVLLAGAGYYGIWQEHNQDAYFIADKYQRVIPKVILGVKKRLYIFCPVSEGRL
mgnify:CR=1 FL=1